MPWSPTGGHGIVAGPWWAGSHPPASARAVGADLSPRGRPRSACRVWGTEPAVGMLPAGNVTHHSLGFPHRVRSALVGPGCRWTRWVSEPTRWSVTSRSSARAGSGDVPVGPACQPPCGESHSETRPHDGLPDGPEVFVTSRSDEPARSVSTPEQRTRAQRRLDAVTVAPASAVPSSPGGETSSGSPSRCH